MAADSKESQLKFHTKIAALAPAKVEFEFAFLVGDEGEASPSIFADGKVPAAMGVEHLVGIGAGAAEFFVRHADDVEGEVVGGIAQIPFTDAVFIVGPIIGGGQGIVHVAEPKNWFPFRAVRNGDGISDGDFAGRGAGGKRQRGEQHQPKNAGLDGGRSRHRQRVTEGGWHVKRGRSSSVNARGKKLSKINTPYGQYYVRLIREIFHNLSCGGRRGGLNFTAIEMSAFRFSGFRVLPPAGLSEKIR